MRFSNLNAAPRAVTDVLAAKLLPTMAALPVPRTLAFLRLFFVAVARSVGVQGCSLKAISMRTPEEILEAAARVIAVLLPDQERCLRVVDEALAGLTAQPAWSDAARPVPDPDLSPLRGDSTTRNSASPGRRETSVRTDMSDEVAQLALQQLGEAARRAKVWRSSRELTVEDGFTPAELQRLRTLPEYGWLKEDENDAMLLRAMKRIAMHHIGGDALPPLALANMLRSEMRIVRRSFAPTHLGGLQLALDHGDERTARILLAELSLIADADVPEELLPRVLLAREMTRSSKSEMASILGAKSKAPCAVADLPLQLRERISRLSGF
jgi:hypothetical protein